MKRYQMQIEIAIFLHVPALLRYSYPTPHFVWKKKLLMIWSRFWDKFTSLRQVFRNKHVEHLL